jgi:pantoate--beta-alanine ligase
MSLPPDVSTVAGLRSLLEQVRGDGRSIGFVPTMGYLHTGHGSLIEAAHRDNDVVVVSIFVNPLQFAADEDLSDYPRDLEHDRELAGEAGADLLFTPTVEEMYPEGAVLTTVSVDSLAGRWEGASRPTHFAGVSTVVAKLFSIVGESSAYFGEKDFQQLTIIRRMVADLSMPIDVVGCPIVREPDGLAMSSRNSYLDPEQRAAAPVLRRALDHGLELVERGERSPVAVADAMRRIVEAEPLATLDYAAAVDAATLTEPAELAGEIRLVIAARVGRPRLLDNAGATLPT